VAPSGTGAASTKLNIDAKLSPTHTRDVDKKPDFFILLFVTSITE
jgi:hypothetical protein